MKANEIYKDINPYQTDHDTLDVASLFDTRKVKLTLEELNKLKKIRALRDLENSIRIKNLNSIYGS